MCRSATSAGPSRVSNVYPIGPCKGQTQPITPSAGNLRNRLDAVAAHDFMYGSDVSALRYVIRSCRRWLGQSALVP